MRIERQIRKSLSQESALQLPKPGYHPVGWDLV